MMKELLFSILFLIGFSITLTTGLSIVYAQDNIVQTSTTNLTQIFGEPIYKETSRQSSNSIVLNVEDGIIKTQDSYTATGILKNVGNVTDKSNFITTYQTDAGNTSTSTGKGIITTKELY